MNWRWISWITRINWRWIFEEPSVMAYLAVYSVIYGLAILALFILIAIDTPTWSHIIAPILFLPILYFLGVKGWHEWQPFLKR